MNQNTSPAVMQQRKEPADSLDFFPTPPWATRALCEQIRDWRLRDKCVWEPACGEGHMAKPLAEYFGTVHASDVHPYGFGKALDFLFPTPPSHYPDWIITNPPFRLGAEFARRAMEIATEGVALLVRSAFLEGVERHNELFGPRTPWAVFQFAERVPMVKGRYDPKASTATAYNWIVWRTDIRVDHARLFWIPPCRKQLERETDWREAVE